MGTRELHRARALAELGRWDEARDRLVHVLAGEPDNVDALCLLAQCHAATGMNLEALAVTDRATTVAPDSPAAHRLRSEVLRVLGRHDEAVAAGEECVRLEPESWRSLVTLALALEGLPERRREAWLAAVEGVRLGPEVADAHFVVGVVASSLGWLTHADSAYRRALALDPQHAGALNNLAVLDMRSGRVAEAVSGFGAALRNDPTLHLAHGNVQAAAWSVLRDVSVASFGSTWVIALLLLLEYDGFTSVPRRFGVLLLVLGYVHLVRRVLGRVPRELRDALLTLPRRSRVFAAATAGALVAAIQLVVSGLLPAQSARIVLPTALIGLVVVFLSWIVWNWRHAPGYEGHDDR